MLGFPVDRARGGPSSGFSRLIVDDFHARTYFLCETGLEYMPSPPSPGHPRLAPLLGDLLLPPPRTRCLPDQSLLHFCRPFPPPQGPPAPSPHACVFPGCSQLGGTRAHAGGMHPPMRGSRGTLPSSGILRSWHMASAPPVVGGNIWDSF